MVWRKGGGLHLRKSEHWDPNPQLPLLSWLSVFLKAQQSSKMLQSLSDPGCPCGSLHGPVLSGLWVQSTLNLSATLQMSAVTTALPFHTKFLLLAYVFVLASFHTLPLFNVQMASSFTFMQIWFLPHCRNSAF